MSTSLNDQGVTFADGTIQYSAQQPIYQAGQTISVASSIPANVTGYSFGKLTITAPVTVANGSRWVIVG